MRKIARLKDAFRRFFLGGKVVVTAGVHALPETVRAAALVRVSRFTEFTKENDPHGDGEHDFGAFELYREKLFWKIDYYDPQGEFASEDPADPEKTLRVLTLMLAHGY
jgi:hypothetical protein